MQGLGKIWPQITQMGASKFCFCAHLRNPRNLRLSYFCCGFIALSLLCYFPLLLGKAATIQGAQESGQSVTGAYEGWYPNPDGTYTLLAGYYNRNTKETLDVPAGPNNRIEPGGPDQGQPTHFLPRRQWGVFTITVPKDFGDKRLIWTITANGQTTSIPMNLNPLWVVAPFKDASGNAAPVVRFEPAGRSFAGPPRGIAQTLTANIADPVALTAWVTDEASTRPQRGGGRGGAAPVSVFWSLFRGPGMVTFENARPRVEEGKATTSARFSAPGDYILRLQANNSTGDGGAGFQCCWTNVHVKVTVKAPE